MRVAPRLLFAVLLLCLLATPALSFSPLGGLFGGDEEEEVAADQSRSPIVVKSTIALYAAAADGSRAQLQLPLGSAANVSIYRRPGAPNSLVLAFQVCLPVQHSLTATPSAGSQEQGNKPNRQDT